MKSEVFCLTCHETGKPKYHTAGSIWIEIILWLCFIVPGLVYSFWRLSTRRKVCAVCGGATLVPPGSSAARSAARRSLQQMESAALRPSLSAKP